MFNGMFVPEKDTFFYVKSNGYNRIINESGSGPLDTIQKVIHQPDHSYNDRVFLCKGHDDTHVVATTAYGTRGFSSADELKIFPRHEWKFAPVGPEVALALGLVDCTTADAKGQDEQG